MYLFLTITLTYFNNNLKIMNFLNIISWKASHHCKLFFSSWWIRQISKENHRSKGNSLAVQRLGLHALTAEDLGSIPGQGTKIPQALWRGHKTKQNNNKKTKARNLKSKTWLFYFCHAWHTSRNSLWDFPGGPVGKTPRSQCRAPGSEP